MAQLLIFLHPKLSPASQYWMEEGDPKEGPEAPRVKPDWSWDVLCGLRQVIQQLYARFPITKIRTAVAHDPKNSPHY